VSCSGFSWYNPHGTAIFFPGFQGGRGAVPWEGILEENYETVPGWAVNLGKSAPLSDYFWNEEETVRCLPEQDPGRPGDICSPVFQQGYFP
jgi:hypothetical protein